MGLLILFLGVSVVLVSVPIWLLTNLVRLLRRLYLIDLRQGFVYIMRRGMQQQRSLVQ